MQEYFKNKSKIRFKVLEKFGMGGRFISYKRIFVFLIDI